MVANEEWRVGEVLLIEFAANKVRKHQESWFKSSLKTVEDMNAFIDAKLRRCIDVVQQLKGNTTPFVLSVLVWWLIGPGTRDQVPQSTNQIVQPWPTQLLQNLLNPTSPRAASISPN